MRRVFDHVTIRVPELEEARRFYATAVEPLGFVEPATDGHFYEWGDLSISLARADRPVTRRAHVALSASPEQVDAFWRAATATGYRDNGAPGSRSRYHEGYYGAFVLDPAENNIEAVHHGVEPGGGMIDHIFIRVRDLAASRRFYETVLEPLRQRYWAEGDEPDGDSWVALGEAGREPLADRGTADREPPHRLRRFGQCGGGRVPRRSARGRAPRQRSAR